MLSLNEKMTVQTPSAPTDGEQSPNTDISIISSESLEIKTQAKKERLRLLGSQLTQQSSKNFLPTVNLEELFDEVYRDKPAIVENLIYPGTYILAGAPKVGKSFFVAQLAYHIATGQKLWDYEVKQSTVLYLALEDDHRRLQKRMCRMFGVDGTANLHFAITSKKLGEGLEDQLEEFIDKHPNTRIIIIDTLQKIRQGGNDTYSYANDYECVGYLKKFADQKEICLLIVHHTRKQQASDKFDMISGTTGILGCADGAFILQKEKRTDSTATLDIVGRDQCDQKLYLVRNQEKLFWELDHAETELWKAPPDPIVLKISEFITNENPKWSGTASELVEILKLDIPPNALTKKLNIGAGNLENDFGIRYENSRNHDGRRINFELISSEA
ncbi:MAG: AAA family ATPase [Lachnospiraceae bacterium]|nr:AAA family ATPase [Lachnospiraceae bacterium]